MGGTVIICCVVGIILSVVGISAWRKIQSRRRIYDDVSGSYRLFEDEDGLEMGRRGLRKFTYREIDPRDLVRGELLGKGSFGKVRIHRFSSLILNIVCNKGVQGYLERRTCWYELAEGVVRLIRVSAIKTFEGILLNEADEKMLMEIREEAQMMEQLGN